MSCGTPGRERLSNMAAWRIGGNDRLLLRSRIGVILRRRNLFRSHLIVSRIFVRYLPRKLFRLLVSSRVEVDEIVVRFGVVLHVRSWRRRPRESC